MSTLIAIVCAVLRGANGGTFQLYGIDKRRAQRGKWRIPEKTLLLHTWLLGGVGGLLGMKLFRHKTKHTAFILSGYLSCALTVGALVMALAAIAAH